MEILDARTIAPAVRHTTIFDTFDALPVGGRFVLVNDHYPKPLLYQFLAERQGQFEWNVLEAGPALHRVELVKREDPEARGVLEILQADHERLDAIAEELDEKLGAGEVAGAQGRLGELTCGLERHMHAEEAALFPAFERATGMAGGPIHVMLHEHNQIRNDLAGMASALHSGDASRAKSTLASMMSVLAEHNAKEESIIYGRTDQALDDRARDALVQQILTV
ncbi:MAG: DUF2249 domain-containing protein [Sorangiineae bacterium]|nr:DUF2249 domain-containing protein [Polyangiaceae bacterium]MEB2323431.1 DUF2249 domain-containing protein [Sorangiineae bacterium]